MYGPSLHGYSRNFSTKCLIFLKLLELDRKAKVIENLRKGIVQALEFIDKSW